MFERLLRCWMLLAVGTLCGTSEAAFIPFDIQRSVITASGIVEGDPLSLTEAMLDQADRAAYSRGLFSEASQTASASALSMLIASPRSGDGKFTGRGASITSATSEDGETGFAAAKTEYRIDFRITERAVEYTLRWELWIGRLGIPQVEQAMVEIVRASSDEVVAGFTLRAGADRDTGRLSGSLPPGQYVFKAMSLAVSNPDLFGKEEVDASAGFSFDLTVVPSPMTIFVFGGTGLIGFARRRRG